MTFEISEKHKQPQYILYQDDTYFFCVQCTGLLFQYGGQNEHEFIHDGGELDGEPYYTYDDLYRCIGCQKLYQINDDVLPSYKGPVTVTAGTLAPLSTDELHELLRRAEAAYDKARENYEGNDYAIAIANLDMLQKELRRRHELWIKLPQEILLKRYACGLIVHPIDSVMDEWQEEIERRGLPLPDRWHDESEAHSYLEDYDSND